MKGFGDENLIDLFISDPGHMQPLDEWVRKNHQPLDHHQPCKPEKTHTQPKKRKVRNKSRRTKPTNKHQKDANRTKNKKNHSETQLN
jgi:hypothetical protein